jgi:hypothetical protein
MTCRHINGDPSCSSYPSYVKEQERIRNAAIGEALLKRTPNPDDYEIVDVKNLCGNIVMKVQYSSCVECSFDAMKVMVFLNVDILAAMKWRRIDPHFDDKPRTDREAPSPNARFPATPQGWDDAISYATTRKQPVYRSRNDSNDKVQDWDKPA